MELFLMFGLAYSGITYNCKHAADEQREGLSLWKRVFGKCYSSCCFDLLYPRIQPTVQPLLCGAVLA